MCLFRAEGKLLGFYGLFFLKILGGLGKLFINLFYERNLLYREVFYCMRNMTDAL
ncbi:MAG: hypothetical protein H6Q17_299 [Bacteroidetes bacterium]|jgi:hypothetical protein|nr:hypothetical protein [Bacteroidota bacterium]